MPTPTLHPITHQKATALMRREGLPCLPTFRHEFTLSTGAKLARNCAKDARHPYLLVSYAFDQRDMASL